MNSPTRLDSHWLEIARDTLRVTVSPYGATITGIYVPDRNGKLGNVVLHYAREQMYRENKWYLGATIGRYANRIAGASFSLDGVDYALSANEGTVTLHGGQRGFDRALWEPIAVTDTKLILRYVSPDGDQGFPGTLGATVAFDLLDDETLEISYHAMTSAPTVVNLTNHSYFNLAADPSVSVSDDLVKLFASRYTPVDGKKIPTGEILPVPDHLDFRHGRVIQPLDLNFVIDRSGSDEDYAPAAHVYSAASGRALHLDTTEPGLQVFSGKGNGLALEPQHFPDSPHHPNFPSTVLRPGEQYVSRSRYRFPNPRYAPKSDSGMSVMERQTT